MPGVEVSSENRSWMDGGYYYNSKYQIRTFNLKCFFEDITREELNQILLWLSKDSCGKLVFDDKKDVYYMVRPSGLTNLEPYGVRHGWMNQVTYSGTFTAVMTAYDPLGVMDITSVEDEALGTDYSYCGILPASMMPPEPTVSDTSFLVYNCGTHRCEPVIELKGSAPSGMTIRNISNGTSCALVGLPEEGIVRVDGRLGLVAVVTEGGEEDAFELHDDGYITLESYGTIYRDVVIQTTSESNRLTVAGFIPTTQ